MGNFKRFVLSIIQKLQILYAKLISILINIDGRISTKIEDRQVLTLIICWSLR